MRKLTRRELLKVSLGTMGALALANLPNWNKPSLRVGVLPAHAQVSQARDDLQVRLTWDKGLTEPPEGGDKVSFVDCDLYVEEPDGTLVWFANMQGPTASLDIDNWWGFGPETTTVPEGMAAAGTYYIYVDAYVDDPEDLPVTLTIKITSFMNTPQQQTATFTVVYGQGPAKEQFYGYPVAKVDFPSGVISAWNPAKPIAIPGGKKH